MGLGQQNGIIPIIMIGGAFALLFVVTVICMIAWIVS
jgi:hypothetical protein